MTFGHLASCYGLRVLVTWTEAMVWESETESTALQSGGFAEVSEVNEAAELEPVAPALTPIQCEEEVAQAGDSGRQTFWDHWDRDVFFKSRQEKVGMRTDDATMGLCGFCYWEGPKAGPKVGSLTPRKVAPRRFMANWITFEWSRKEVPSGIFLWKAAEHRRSRAGLVPYYSDVSIQHFLIFFAVNSLMTGDHSAQDPCIKIGIRLQGRSQGASLRPDNVPGVTTNCFESPQQLYKKLQVLQFSRPLSGWTPVLYNVVS